MRRIFNFSDRFKLILSEKWNYTYDFIQRVCRLVHRIFRSVTLTPANATQTTTNCNFLKTKLFRQFVCCYEILRSYASDNYQSG